MFIGVVVVVAVVLLASIAAGPFRDSDPATRLRRRRRYLSRHEERATVADLELLLSDVLPRPLVRPLANRIRRDRLEPPALWHWASANGATSLASPCARASTRATTPPWRATVSTPRRCACTPS